MRIKAIAGIAVAATAATAALPAQAGTARKVVTINDNFFLPAEMKVKRDTVVVWKWPNDSGDVHDLKLDEQAEGREGLALRPGCRRLLVQAQADGCRAGTGSSARMHEDMEMNITVRKRR